MSSSSSPRNKLLSLFVVAGILLARPWRSQRFLTEVTSTSCHRRESLPIHNSNFGQARRLVDRGTKQSRGVREIRSRSRCTIDNRVGHAEIVVFREAELLTVTSASHVTRFICTAGIHGIMVTLRIEEGRVANVTSNWRVFPRRCRCRRTILTPRYSTDRRRRDRKNNRTLYTVWIEVLTGGLLSAWECPDDSDRGNKHVPAV